MREQGALHEPGAVLDYQFDWSGWLNTDETIYSYEVTASSGLTVAATSLSGVAVTAWLAGGTAGTTYTVTCAVSTSAGRSVSRYFTLYCAAR